MSTKSALSDALAAEDWYAALQLFKSAASRKAVAGKYAAAVDICLQGARRFNSESEVACAAACLSQAAQHAQDGRVPLGGQSAAMAELCRAIYEPKLPAEAKECGTASSAVLAWAAKATGSEQSRQELARAAHVLGATASLLAGTSLADAAQHLILTEDPAMVVRGIEAIASTVMPDEADVVAAIVILQYVMAARRVAMCTLLPSSVHSRQLPTTEPSIWRACALPTTRGAGSLGMSWLGWSSPWATSSSTRSWCASTARLKRTACC